MARTPARGSRWPLKAERSACLVPMQAFKNDKE